MTGKIAKGIVLWCLLLFAVGAWAQSVSGRVFVDNNENQTYDAGEPAPTATVYVKLVQNGTVVSVATMTGTGTYSFSGVANGSYTVVVSTNNFTYDPNPTVPSGYSFRSPVSGTLPLTVSGSNVANVNFAMVTTGSCVCGFQDGNYTSTPITIDGDMSDWAAALGDPDNNSCDPLGSADADYPIQSTGRDVVQVAVTFYNQRVYVYTKRAGSNSNVQRFIYYHDFNNNGYMEAGEKVVVVSWQGNNTSADVYVGTYVPYNSTTGDPVASPTTGKVDGYKMPGTIANLNYYGSGPGIGVGSPDGTMMEWSVPFDALKPTANSVFSTIIRFHTSTTNSQPGSGSFPGQVDDNVGGCSNCFVTNQNAGVQATGNNVMGVTANSTVVGVHTIKNTGNGPDRFNLSYATSGNFTPTSVKYYLDANNNGVYDSGTDTPLTDTNGDGQVDTGLLQAGVQVQILMVATVGTGSGSATISTTVTSAWTPGTCSGYNYSPPSVVVTDQLAFASSMSGYVYADANHNSVRESSEGGTGVTLYAKLVPSGTPSGPASQVATVDPSSGLFTFSSVTVGTYNIVINASNLASNVTPAIPSGWAPTEQPTFQRTGVTMSTSAVSNQNFGLYHGSRIDGMVLKDNGAGSGTSANGIKDGSEMGIANISVKATDGTGTYLFDQTSTDGAGNFTLWLTSAATQIRLVETNGSGYISVAANVGNTSGTYSLANDVITFTNTAGTFYSGVVFSDVPPNDFDPDNTGTTQPGSAIFYTHYYSAASAGQLTFFATVTASPAISGWTETYYIDSNCNGQLDSGEPALTLGSPITTTAGQKICLLVREFAPSNAAINSKDTISLRAQFVYNAQVTANLTHTDVTTVGAGLRLTKSVNKSTALPGDILTYTITYLNFSTSTLGSIVVQDNTPPYTTYVASSATCGTLPSALTNCTITAPAGGSSGTVTWTFTGLLNASQSGTVTFQVKVQQ